MLDYQKISDTQGGFLGALDNSDLFGRAAISIGDLDGDGITDIAVGAEGDDDGGINSGAVWIIFLNADGTAKIHQKISNTQGNFTGLLSSSDRFGASVCLLGDLDGDGVQDIAVGAWRDDDGGSNKGAVWILFLNPNGTVKSHQKISSLQGNFTGALSSDDGFGIAVATIGDLDNDGVKDMIVGAPKDDDGGGDRGSVWIVFLNLDGTVKSQQKISDLQGGFSGTLSNADWWGQTVSEIGDLNNDGVLDVAVGALLDDDGGTDRGAIWILFLNVDGTVLSHQKISNLEGNFWGALSNVDRFGVSMTAMGDINGDLIQDVAVGAFGDDDGGSDIGAVWLLYLTETGTVCGYNKISDTQGGFTGGLNNSDGFATSIGGLGDFDGNGTSDLIVGARHDDDGGFDRGTAWILFLEDTCKCDLTANFSSDVVCVGSATTFTDLSVDTVDSIVSWRWYFGDGDSLIGNANPTHSYASAGTYVTTLIVGNDAVPPCFDTILQSTIVGDTFTVSLGNDTALCLGTALTLSSLVSGASYLWQDSSASSSLQVSSAGGYWLQVTRSGCVQTDTIDVSYNDIPDPDLGVDTTLCSADSLVLDAITSATAYLWLDGSTNATLTVNQSGTYWVSASDSGCTAMDTIVVVFVPSSIANLGNDTTLCQGVTLNLSATIGGATYLWNDGSNSSSNQVSSAGTYWLQVTVNGCVKADTINVSYNDLPDPDLGVDTTLCSGDSLVLDATTSATSYLWQDGSGNVTFAVTQSGTYWVSATDSGCTATDSMVAVFVAPPIVNLGNDTTLCPGIIVNLDAFLPNATYTWQDGSTNSNFLVSSPGSYSVTVTVNGCATTDLINISYISSVTVDLGNDTTLCSGASLVLDASAAVGNYLWQDGTVNPTLTVIQSGTYTVAVSDSGCVTVDSIEVVVTGTPVVNLGNDTLLCSGAILNLDASFPNATYQWQDTSSAPSFSVMLPGIYSVTSTINGCSDVDTIIIGYIAPVPVNIGNDTTLCQGSSVALDASSYPGTYVWHDGSFNASTSVSQTGTYWVEVLNNGCVNTDSINITFILPQPLVVSGDTAFCLGDSGQISLEGAVSYQWVPLSGLSSDTISNPLAFPSDTTLYTVNTIDSNGCANSTVLQIYPVSPPALSIVGKADVCGGDSVSFTASGGLDYLWSNGDSGSITTVSPPTSTWYSVQAWNLGCGQSSSDSIFLTVNQLPMVDAGLDTTILLGDNTILLGSGGMIYSWSPVEGLSCSACQFPIASPLETTVYSLAVVDDNGCRGSDLVTVYVDVTGEIFVPNLFSPNGDGVNDLFHFDGRGIFEAELLLYNRWGELLFSSTSADRGWDGSFRGQQVNPGVFVYVIKGQFVNGNDFIQKGNLTLVR